MQLRENHSSAGVKVLLRVLLRLMGSWRPLDLQRASMGNSWDKWDGQIKMVLNPASLKRAQTVSAGPGQVNQWSFQVFSYGSIFYRRANGNKSKRPSPLLSWVIRHKCSQETEKNIVMTNRECDLSSFKVPGLRALDLRAHVCFIGFYFPFHLNYH